MNYRSSSRLSYRNVLIAAGLAAAGMAAALGAGQNPDGSLDGAAGNRLNGHEGTLPTATAPIGGGDIVPRGTPR